MANTEEDSIEVRLERLRELRDRGPAAGAPDGPGGGIDPDEMNAKRVRLRDMRGGAGSQSAAASRSAAPAAAAPQPVAAQAAAPKPAPAPAVTPLADNMGATGDPSRQMAARFLGALRGGAGPKVAGTAYTEEGIGNFLGMLENASKTNNRPFFDRIYKFCFKAPEEGDRMLGEVNLTNLLRAAEVFERVQTEGMEAVRGQLRGGGGGQPGMAAGAGRGGGPPRGPGGGAGQRFAGRPAHTSGPAATPAGGAGNPAGSSGTQEVSDKIAELEKTINQLKQQLGRRS